VSSRRRRQSEPSVTTEARRNRNPRLQTSQSQHHRYRPTGPRNAFFIRIPFEICFLSYRPAGKLGFPEKKRPNTVGYGFPELKKGPGGSHRRGPSCPSLGSFNQNV
jgi:hypothetical protein